MSAVFIIDPRGKRDLGFLDRNPSLGMLVQVLGFISLSSYSAEQGADIMKVIRERLPAAVEEWYPGHEGARQHIAELVELVEEAEAGPSA